MASILTDKRQLISILDAGCAQLVGDDDFGFRDHQLFAPRHMNMLAVIDMLTDLYRLGGFEQIGKTTRGVRKVPIFKELVRFALAKYGSRMCASPAPLG